MTDALRAIALGGLTLEVRPARREEDEPRYTLHQAVEEFVNSGWQLQPSTRYETWYASPYPNWEPTSMAAVFKTACGCERNMVVNYPLPREVRIPFAQTRPVTFQPGDIDKDTTIDVRVRLFELDNVVRDATSGRPVAIYREQV